MLFRTGKALRAWMPCAMAMGMMLCGLCVAGQTPPTGQSEAQHPLWAQLDARADSISLHMGDTVRARVARYWTSRHCLIPDGTEVQGKVVRIEPRQANHKRTTLTLHFTVTCVEGQKVSARLIAMLYPKDSKSKSQMDTYMDMPMGIGPGASGRRSTDASTLPSPFGKGPKEPEPKIRVGQVTGVRHVSMQVSAQEGEDTVLTSKDERLVLQQWTRMAFIVDLPQPQ